MRLARNPIVRESLIVLAGVLAISFIFNFSREDGIPLIAGAEDFRVQTKAEFASIEDAYRLFEDGRAIFIDAGAPEVYALGHIEGAIDAPPGSPELAGLTWLAEADTYVICYTAAKSQRQAGVVADKLMEMGCKSVFVLLGGFEAWDEQGFPVDGTAHKTGE